ncbi:MAG: phosphoribosylformylglycinamidine synthase I [Candidatus Omnitrophica bacterium]|nr:phosphoribosylformylglycinamidine synthase I [Candidatus Omnitrophota bacterium]
MAAAVKVAVLKGPGTNCDQETAFAFEQAGARPDFVWIEQLKENPAVLSGYQILAIPGGFTYGDDLGAGRLMANELTGRLKDALVDFLKQQKLVIGICNGFQVLVKAGILPGGAVGSPQEATLTFNDSGKFEDRWVYLRQEFNVCVWTQGMEELLELPVAHGEGKFVVKDQTVLEQLLGYGQIAFHYCDPQGNEAGYPWNPNGSVGAIAGICDPSGRIFGLMPHPERHMFALQHPRWQREGLAGPGQGLRIFRNGVEWVQKRG